MFSTVEGIYLIGNKAFTKKVSNLITYHAKVTKIHQDYKDVKVIYEG